MCLKAGYTDRVSRIPYEVMLDFLHAIAYPKQAHDGIALEELVCSAAFSVAATTEAADMLRFVGSLLDTMCKRAIIS